MMERFVDAVQDFYDGQITLLDLSSRAGHTAATLDNSSAPLPGLLEIAEGELEYAYFAAESREHIERVRRILAPVLAVLDEAP